MKYKVELVVEVDDEHPEISSYEDQMHGLLVTVEEMFYEDDYLILEEIVVKED